MYWNYKSSPTNLDSSWSIFFLFFLAIEPVVADDPCQPDPCGPNSNPPRVVGDRCQCSCRPEMIGSPPNCRPECVINSDCPSDKACTNQKCQDPCPGLCGINANCRVNNHVPICICIAGFVGDPFSQCYKPSSKLESFFVLLLMVGLTPLSLSLKTWIRIKKINFLNGHGTGTSYNT